MKLKTVLNGNAQIVIKPYMVMTGTGIVGLADWQAPTGSKRRGIDSEQTK